MTGNSCFALLPRAEQAMAISSWGSVLSESCLSSNRLVPLQWVERTVPDLAAEAEVWMRDHLDSGSLGGSAFDDYADLIDRLDEVASTHEVYLVAQIHTRASDLADALSGAPETLESILHTTQGRVPVSEDTLRIPETDIEVPRPRLEDDRLFGSGHKLHDFIRVWKLLERQPTSVKSDI